MTSWSTFEVLAVSSAIVRGHGWVNEEVATQRNRLGTANRIVRAITTGEEFPDLVDDDLKEAEQARKFLAALKGRELIPSDAELVKNFRRWETRNITADSLASASRLFMLYKNGPAKYERKDQWAAFKGCQWVSQPGERINPLVMADVYRKVTKTTNKYGSCTCREKHGWKSKQEGRCGTARKTPKEFWIYTLIPHEEIGEVPAVFKWATDTRNLVEGSTVLIRAATIKSHDLFDDVRFTELSHCDLLPNQ